MAGASADRVLIAGAGPVGLIAALKLSREGIPVTLFESGDRLYDDPRAATTHPATLEMLEDLGVAKEAEEVGLVCKDFCFWDRPTGDLVARFDHSLLADETRFPYVVQCEQFKLSKIVEKKLEAFADTEILFSHEVTGLDDKGDEVVVDVTTPDGPKQFTGRYLIGSDGGRSVVRKSADIPFEGFTYPERFIVFTTPYNFQQNKDFSYRNYFADPDEWCNLFKVAADGPPGLWRTVFPTRDEETDEEVMSDESIQARLAKFFPKDGEYDVVHRNIYVTHQRVAQTFRKGRVMLAGDSAHVNNSIGGMGLNGGIHDAVSMTEKLVQVWKGEEDESLLDLYDRQRRTTCVEFVQAQTIQNKKRLEAKDPESRAKNLQELRETAADPARAKQFMLGTGMISMVRRSYEIE